MERIYHQYHLWEDYKNGLYNDSDVLDKDKKITLITELLSDPISFYDTMKQMVIQWPFCSDENLSNTMQNRKAWLGAAACNFKYKVPEYLVRIGWNLLNKDVQNIANNVAEKIIKEYEAKSNKIHSGMGTEMLF